MSKDIIIQIDGTPETFEDTPRLRTNGLGAGRIGWLPENETRSGMLAASANGTYKASDAGLYGFSRAVVSVPADSITGKGPDGNDYTVTTDSSGYIVETKVPSEIRITTPPDLLTYSDGETIDFTGLTVTAYDGNGQSMGEVPFRELLFPVTVAEYDPEAGPIEEMMSTDVGLGPINQPFPTSATIAGSGIWQKAGGQVGYIESADFSVPGGKLVIYSSNVWDHGYVVVAASTSPTTLYVHRVAEGVFPERTDTLALGETTMYGKTFYWASSYTSFFGPNERDDELVEPISIRGALLNGGDDIRPTGVAIQNLAYAMLFGDVVGYGGGVEIPVQWPSEGRTLKTSFSISVSE